MTSTEAYRVKPSGKLSLAKIPTKDDGGLDKQAGKAQFAQLRLRLRELQALLAAEGKQALLVVFQAMDAAGKDSTIGEVIGPLNPAGVTVTGFKKPSTEERSHDFLWRIHQHAPRKGQIAVFNRSHYEDVLVVRVHDLVSRKRLQERYEQIRDFEKLLVAEGTAVIKFYLHISKDYQKERFQRRLDRPDKQWKFNVGDLPERARWDDYRAAYEEALSRCSTTDAPWYVIPAEKRWYRNLLVTQILIERLEKFEMAYPEPDFDPAEIVIPD